jgi:tmRNA-binding protein
LKVVWFFVPAQVLDVYVTYELRETISSVVEQRLYNSHELDGIQEVHDSFIFYRREEAQLYRVHVPTYKRCRNFLNPLKPKERERRESGGE